MDKWVWVPGCEALPRNEKRPDALFIVTIQHGLVLMAKSQEAPEKNRERTKRVFLAILMNRC
jgi:hypothetical protein